MQGCLSGTLFYLFSEATGLSFFNRLAANYIGFSRQKSVHGRAQNPFLRMAIAYICIAGIAL